MRRGGHVARLALCCGMASAATNTRCVPAALQCVCKQEELAGVRAELQAAQQQLHSAQHQQESLQASLQELEGRLLQASVAHSTAAMGC